MVWSIGLGSYRPSSLGARVRDGVRCGSGRLTLDKRGQFMSKRIVAREGGQTRELTSLQEVPCVDHDGAEYGRDAL